MEMEMGGLTFEEISKSELEFVLCISHLIFSQFHLLSAMSPYTCTVVLELGPCGVPP